MVVGLINIRIIKIMTLKLQASEAESRLLRRLNEYVEANQIQLIDFWKSNRLCLTLDQFLAMLQQINFKVRLDEVGDLETEGVQFMNLEVVLKGVEVWLQQEQSVANFLSKQTQQAGRHKAKSVKQSKVGKFDVRLKTAATQFSDFSQLNRKNGIEKLIKQEVQLNETLVRAKNESDYQLTIKIGEANDICKRLKNDCSYVIDSGQHQTKIIEIQAKSGVEKEISTKIFDKKYEQYKIASLARTEEYDGTLEQDLKKTLVEVMCLSSQLQQQIRVLQAKGIAH